jgi:ribosome-binding protein aMBF1 (putative translation factor)
LHLLFRARRRWRSRKAAGELTGKPQTIGWVQLGSMDCQRFGRSVRALRHRLGWRQEDLARRCGASQTAVSRVERGLLSGVSVARVDRLVVALGAELDIRVRGAARSWIGCSMPLTP